MDRKTGETFSIYGSKGPSEKTGWEEFQIQHAQEPRVLKEPNKDLSTQTKGLVLNIDVLIIPRLSKAIERESKLEAIHRFLEKPQQISEMQEQEFRKFVKKASEFFVLKRKLWRKDRSGRHKQVVQEDKWLEIIRWAHDDLGHKGVFTVHSRIGERFWWPSMDDDIKWYIKTCHECQVRNLKKIMIPPTVPIPSGLFRKVYIDTMLMPKAKGYRYIVHAL